MRPLTESCPKPLIKVAGRTMLDILLDEVIAAGAKKAVINVHYLADQLEAHLSRRDDIEIVISDERDRLLETGGGVRKALPLLGNDPILVINTDQIWHAPEAVKGADLKALFKAFNPSYMDVLLRFAPLKNTIGFRGAGDFFIKDGRPERRGRAFSAPYAYSGIQVTKPQLYQHHAIKPFSNNVIWDEAIVKRRIRAHVMKDIWLHIGDPEALKDAEAYLETGRMP